MSSTSSTYVQCPKCTSLDIRSTYVTTRMNIPEHLVCHCVQCGYDWNMPPADSSSSAGEEVDITERTIRLTDGMKR